MIKNASWWCCFKLDLTEGQISELPVFDMVTAISSPNSWSNFFSNL